MKPYAEGNDAGMDADRHTDEPRITQQERAQALQDEDSKRLLEDGRLGEVQHGKDYEGSLIEDCATVAALGSHFGLLRMIPPPENLFDKARRLNAEQDK